MSNYLKELDKISKLKVKKHQVVRRVMYEFPHSDKSFEEWFKLNGKFLSYEFCVCERVCIIRISEPMMISTDWIEEDGRTTEEACRKAITKFYKSYNNVK